ncbi:mate-domain-containing protein [Scheffersomyces coipomensis]|uniref:mate-domain-containing protein n=1 Tax=Scheffersomyces coipomensis TaxID=1788519 RepID=UPI00315C5544
MVLFPIINKFANPNNPTGLPGGKRRRLFIPPSTQFPLFLYGEGDDQRSFLSLIETSSSVADEEDVSDAASVSTSRSLPSTLNSVQNNDDQESFHSWLLEEHQRRYSALSGDEDEDDENNIVRALEERRKKKKSRRRSSDRHNNRRRHSEVSVLSSLLEDEQEDFATLKTSYTQEFKTIVRYSIPLVITFLLEHFFSIVCLLVVGHLGKNELAAVSLATMTSTITFAIFEGIATSLDTLCPQAYGAGNYELMSIYVQRCTVFSLMVYIPCGLFWWNSSVVLKYVIESEIVLKLTNQFLRILCFGAPAYIFFENSKRFLQAQGIFEAGTGILFVSAPINIFLSYFLVWNPTYGIGFNGAPIATVINFWMMSILLTFYVKFIDGNKCWFGLATFKDIFQKWGQLSQLAIPGIVMLESEYLAYEIMTLFASYFGTTELAAQSTVSSIASLAYMVPFSVGIASSTRIANFIGGQNIEGGIKATRVALCLAVCVACLNCITLFTFKRQIAKLFSQDEEVISLVVKLFNPLVSIIQIFDGIACVASGILRAQGSQKIGGIINFVAYYAFAIPLALVLSKMGGLKLIGLWIGIGSGMIVIGITEIMVILFSDWEQIIIKAGLLNEFGEDDVDDEDDDDDRRGRYRN